LPADAIAALRNCYAGGARAPWGFYAVAAILPAIMNDTLASADWTLLRLALVTASVASFALLTWLIGTVSSSLRTHAARGTRPWQDHDPEWR
jgi:hypothetical protein